MEKVLVIVEHVSFEIWGKKFSPIARNVFRERLYGAKKELLTRYNEGFASTRALNQEEVKLFLNVARSAILFIRNVLLKKYGIMAIDSEVKQLMHEVIEQMKTIVASR